MSHADPLTSVRDMLGRIQSSADERDHDTASALFADDAVLVGSAVTSVGATAIRDYLGVLFEQPGTVRWDWDDVRVVHSGPGSITAVGSGQVGFTDDPGRDAFRLTLLLVERAHGWAIQHFHGSVPAH